MEFNITLRSYTFMYGYSSSKRIITAASLRYAKAAATRWANSVSKSSFKKSEWIQDADGAYVRLSDEVYGDMHHHDFIIIETSGGNA